jgi:cytochrome bd-type quinol oxidase subunit 2
MSRFEQEWAVVPAAARWIAVFAALVYTAVVAAALLLPAAASGEARAMYVLGPVFLVSLLGAVAIACWVLLIGYVHADARRRGMNALLWTLLAIFLPSAIGIILYFLLRDPLAVPCPSCGTPAKKGHAFCASCGASVRRACAQCRQAVEPGWRNCPSCGASLTASPTPTSV